MHVRTMQIGELSMRELKITLIVLLSSLSILMIAILFFGIYSGFPVNLVQMNKNAELVNEQHIDLGQISQIEANFSNDCFDVYIYPSDNDQIILKEYMNFKADKENFASLSTSDSTELIIHGKRINRFDFFLPSKWGYVELYLPKSYQGSLFAETSSGDLKITDDQTLATVRFASSSGEIETDRIHATEIQISASSGSILANELDGIQTLSTSSGEITLYKGTGDGVFSSSSGEITLEEYSGTFQTQTSSGDIVISADSGSGKVSSSSGSIDLSLKKITGNISAESSSGELYLQIPTDSSFQFSADSSSGDINTFFDSSLSYNKRWSSANGTVGSSSNTIISMTTSSGDITVDSF